MFQDGRGIDIIPFPCISGFPLECMHLIDGGVLKKFLEKFVSAATQAIVHPGEDPTGRVKVRSLVDSELEDAINFFQPFCLSDQARTLR